MAGRTVAQWGAGLIRPASSLEGRRRAETSRDLPPGGLLELAAGPRSARMTAATEIVLRAMREGDPAVWIQPVGGGLYPPDLEDAGVDLKALLVVNLPTVALPAGLPRAAELAMRTGAFGAIIVDLTDTRPPGGQAWLGRLSTLAREHQCRLVFLGPERARGSLGPLVGLRLRPDRSALRPGRHRVRSVTLKDKLGLGAGLDLDAVESPEGMP